MDEKFHRVDERFDRVDERFERVDEKFDRIDERFERVQESINEGKLERSETRLRVALKVIGWLAGIVTVVIGSVVGGLFVFARFLLPKLATFAQEATSAIPL